MEHTLIGAYVGLLLGYLIMDNKVNGFHSLFILRMLLMLNCRMIGVEETDYGLAWSSDLAFICRD
jgi:hypothetical protein